MFEQRYRRYRRLALQWAFEFLGDQQLAEDVAQEAFLVAYQSGHQLKDPAAFPAWLKRVVISQCHRQRRRRSSGERPAEHVAEMADPQTRDAAAQQAVNQTLEQALKTLPAGQRQAVTMFYLEGRSLREIARAIGASQGAIKKRLFDARRALRPLLQD